MHKKLKKLLLRSHKNGAVTHPDNYREVEPNTENKNGAVAQSVEQKTENLCVGGSIPSYTTLNKK